MKLRIYIYYFSILAAGVCSCKEMIEIPDPATQVTLDKAFADSSLALQATLNLYASLATYENNFTSRIALYTGEVNSTSTSSLYLDFINNTVQPDNGNTLNVWKCFYDVIYQANTVIEALTNSTSFSSTLRGRLIGESKFLRAYCYFYLVNIWGDVPLLLTSDVNQTSTASRESTSVIYTQIIQDLNDALDVLSTYPGEEKVRAGKLATQALLARVYLYNEEWDKALYFSDEVINFGSFSPLPALEDTFIKNNKEAILQLWNANGYSSLSAMVPSSSTSVPTFILPDQFIEEFEPTDRRKNIWIGSRTIAEVSYAYPTKYKLRTTTTGDRSEYTVLLRLSEQYLIRAEANINLGNFGAAYDDLNILRNRAGLPNITAIDIMEAAMNQLMIERHRELFIENGHYFFDLKRWQVIDQVVSINKTNWKQFMALLPIPQNERSRNPSLSQNPGYQ